MNIMTAPATQMQNRLLKVSDKMNWAGAITALQDILDSSGIAVMMIDGDLNICMVTPAVKLFIDIDYRDVGSPIPNKDGDEDYCRMISCIHQVGVDGVSIQYETTTPDGRHFIRKISPCWTALGNSGVIVTFNDVTSYQMAVEVLQESTRKAELANVEKSRFLATASHDLRQPLQTLALIQGLLARAVESESARRLVTLLDQTATAMSGMLNTLLDINQIDAGAVHPNISDVDLGNLLVRVGDEFAYHALAYGLELRVMPCKAWIQTDPSLLEQIIRNLLWNALKYTRRGKVLLGCRRRGNNIEIGVYDTGIGIEAVELESIFSEYYQVGESANDVSRAVGLGLGLAIVKRLGSMLGHEISVRSEVGRGSVFTVSTALSQAPRPAMSDGTQSESSEAENKAGHAGTILVIEDDSDVRYLLVLALEKDGHRVTAERDGPSAIERVVENGMRPDLILADYNLPNGMDGLQVAAVLREKLGYQVPVIILTGDVTTVTLRHIENDNYVHLRKPVKIDEIGEVVRRAMAVRRVVVPPKGATVKSADRFRTVFIIDDEHSEREAMRSLFMGAGFAVEDYADCEAFLGSWRPRQESCLLVDSGLPGMGGLELLRRLGDAGHKLPAIMITNRSNVSMAIQAIKAGAVDYVDKSIAREDFVTMVRRVLDQARTDGDAGNVAAGLIATLTTRELQIMKMVLAGNPSKNIAADLGISQRTVENHRAAIMKKTGSKSLPALARLALAAS